MGSCHAVISSWSHQLDTDMRGDRDDCAGAASGNWTAALLLLLLRLRGCRYTLGAWHDSHTNYYKRSGAKTNKRWGRDWTGMEWTSPAALWDVDVDGCALCGGRGACGCGCGCGDQMGGKVTAKASGKRGAGRSVGWKVVRRTSYGGQLQS